MNPTDADDAIIKEIVIKAPAARIFEALVDPRQRVKWWGAEGRFQTTHMESDLRPGGTWLMRGIGADGKHFSVRGEYRAIERPRLLEFTWLPDWQEDAPLTLVRFDLEEKDGFTRVRLTHSGHTTKRSRESHQGWPQILARLQAHVAIEAASDHSFREKGDTRMTVVSVRYIVDNVDAAIAFYTKHLDFRVDLHPAPGFASLSRGNLRLLLNEPGAGGAGQAMPDGRKPAPGGWNRIQLQVEDLAAMVETLRKAGAHFRNDIVIGNGGKQILLDDPAGNCIELSEPLY